MAGAGQERCIHLSRTAPKTLLAALFFFGQPFFQAFTLGRLEKRFSGAIFSVKTSEKCLQCERGLIVCLSLDLKQTFTIYITTSHQSPPHPSYTTTERFLPKL